MPQQEDPYTWLRIVDLSLLVLASLKIDWSDSNKKCQSHIMKKYNGSNEAILGKNNHNLSWNLSHQGN